MSILNFSSLRSEREEALDKSSTAARSSILRLPAIAARMTSLFLRVSIIVRLLQSILYALPKTIRSILTSSWPPAAAPPPPRPTTICSDSELIRVFQTFDHDGDEKITTDELRESLENLGIFVSEVDLKGLMERMDANGDGCVDMDEFGALYWAIVGERGREEVEEDLKETFEVFDVNGDGYISGEELGLVLSSLGLRQGRASPEEVGKMIKKVDEDGDGRVSFKEFKEMMKVGGFAALN